MQALQESLAEVVVIERNKKRLSILKFSDFIIKFMKMIVLFLIKFILNKNI